MRVRRDKAMSSSPLGGIDFGQSFLWVELGCAGWPCAFDPCSMRLAAVLWCYGLLPLLAVCALLISAGSMQPVTLVRSPLPLVGLWLLSCLCL